MFLRVVLCASCVPFVRSSAGRATHPLLSGRRSRATRRPVPAARQRSRRGQRGRDRRAVPAGRAAVLRGRLEAAGGHVVARRPDTAAVVQPVRHAQRLLAGHPDGDGRRAGPVHVPGVQRAGPRGLVERHAPGLPHVLGRQRAGRQPVPGADTARPWHRRVRCPREAHQAAAAADAQLPDGPGCEHAAAAQGVHR